MSSQVFAQKISFEAGSYSLTAEPPSGSTSGNVKVRTFGVYSLSANFSLAPQIQLGVGYSVFFSKVLSGDMGFGPDFSLNYYYLGIAAPLGYSDQSASYRESEFFRPYVGMSFHQRQFQSIQSSYSGFGVVAGAEIQADRTWSYRFGVRSQALKGPSNTNMSYIDFLLGLQMGFQ